MADELEQVLTEVGPRLRALRERRNITLAALSKATGISVSTLSRLESGGRRPSLELLLPLAKAHQVPLDELVGAPPTGDPRVHLQPIHCGENCGHSFRLGERLVGGCSSRGDCGGEGLVHLVGRDLPDAIEREVPCDANQPGLHVENAAEFVPALQNSDEDILDDVFGLGLIAQNGKRDAIEDAGVVANQRGEIGLSVCSFC